MELLMKLSQVDLTLETVEKAGARLLELLQDPDSASVVVYFGVLALAILVVIASWAHACFKRLGVLKGIVTCAGSASLAFTALYVCWGAIFRFMMDVSKEKGCGPGLSPGELIGCNTPAWQECDVFVQAYIDVTETIVGWQSSSQLLMFVLSGCTFLHLECQRLGVSRVVSISYILVGFLGAISLAFPLLFAHLYALSRDVGASSRPSSSLNLPLILCNLIAMCGVVALPLTFETHRHTVYRFALLLVHFILGIPAAFKTQASKSRLEKDIVAVFYMFLAGASLLMHIQNVFKVALEMDLGNSSSSSSSSSLDPVEFAKHLFLGPFSVSECQFSISFDVVFTSIAASVFMLFTRPGFGFVCALLTPVLSVAVTFPLFLAFETLKRPLSIGQKLKK